jgi:aspartyl-tRNA(Asn)/glutamyl-tRNA(Gln) amidotransferase subunit C
MKIDLDYIANLARLELTPDEKEKFTKQLTNVFEYMDKLNSVSTDNVPATSHPVDLAKIGITGFLQRDDVAAPFGNRDALAANAPESEGGYYKVPKVIG